MDCSGVDTFVTVDVNTALGQVGPKLTRGLLNCELLDSKRGIKILIYCQRIYIKCKMRNNSSHLY